MLPNRRRVVRRRRAALRTGAAIALTAGSLAVTGFGAAGATSPSPNPIDDVTPSIKPPATATASPSPAETPQGVLKIHATGTPVGDPSEQVHVCRFYLDVTGFRPDHDAFWVIFGPGGARVDHGTVDVDSEGNGHSIDLSLPNGDYKLLWGDSVLPEPNRKEFSVECSTSSTPTPTPTSTTPTEAPTPTPVGTDLPVTG